MRIDMFMFMLMLMFRGLVLYTGVATFRI